MVRLTRCLAWIVLPALTALVAHAQSVRWEAGDSALGNTVALLFEDCEPTEDPKVPTLSNATLALAGRSTSVNMTNFNVSRTVALTYMVQSRRGGALQIPEFTVQTNKGPLRVAAYNGAAPSISADSIAASKLIPEATSVWAGEVFGLTYELTAARRNNPQMNPTFEWTPAPLVVEEWPKFDLTEAVENGQRQVKLSYRTRAMARTAGTVKLEPASHLVQVQTGSMGGISIFSSARMEPVTVTSNQPTIEVRPLPQAPSEFSGAVGQFKLTSKVVPTEAAIGEPVTWTLELSGTGNWPDINGLPAREVSKDFQVVQPKPKRTAAEGKLFDVTLTEDVVLVPTKAGTYTLNPVVFTFFNTRTGSYETVRTERATVTIAAAAIPQFGATPAAAPVAQPSKELVPTSPAAPTKQVTAPAAPAGIPRDPLPGRGSARVPLRASHLLAWMLAPVPLLLGLWVALAWRRAARTDPLHPQREAFARLSALLKTMRSAPQSTSGSTGSAPVALTSLLLQWQHDAAVLWQVSHAAPSHEAIPDAAWALLWREADRAIYGRDAALPSDWLARAEAALTAKRVPRVKRSRLFLPHNLLPFAAVFLVAATVLLPATLIAAAALPPADSYRSGDFTAAERTWRASIKQRSTDWIARHNLALTLAQQDRASEAAAHASVAFVQHPRHPSVRWLLSWTTGKAGVAPAPLLPFLKEGPTLAIAALASPAEWQTILIVSAFLLAGSLGWILVNAYAKRMKTHLWAAAALGALALISGLIATFGIVSYGNAADPRAVITWQPGLLRSIPTEADTTQKTTALPAGSIAIVDAPKQFLGWHRLVFPNGQTGWVRQEAVVPLW